jgi:hypothetical protein
MPESSFHHYIKQSVVVGRYLFEPPSHANGCRDGPPNTGFAQGRAST